MSTWQFTLVAAPIKILEACYYTNNLPDFKDQTIEVTKNGIFVVFNGYLDGRTTGRWQGCANMANSCRGH